MHLLLNVRYSTIGDLTILQFVIKNGGNGHYEAVETLPFSSFTIDVYFKSADVTFMPDIKALKGGAGLFIMSIEYRRTVFS